MKITGLLFPIVISSFPFLPLTAQENQVKIGRFSAREVQVQSGIFMQSTIPGNLHDFRKLAPESFLLNNDLSGFSQRMSGGSYTGTMFSLQAGFRFSDNQKKAYKINPLIRMGVTYYSGSSMTNHLYKRTSGTYDILTSSQTGETFRIDSTNRESIHMNFFTRHLRFDGALIYRTFPGARFSLFTGAGFTAGLTIGAQTNISHSSNTWLNTYSSSDASINYSKSFDSDFYESETLTNSPQFGFSGYIPLGINFRVAKKHAFWSHLHVFFEMRMGIDFIVIKNIKTLENTIRHQGVGLKIKW
jgi:hypothetical protein